MDYFNYVFTIFLGLERVSFFFVVALNQSLASINLCSKKFDLEENDCKENEYCLSYITVSAILCKQHRTGGNKAH